MLASSKTAASTHHGLGTRCRFHAFADVLSIMHVFHISQRKNKNNVRKQFCCFAFNPVGRVLPISVCFWSGRHVNFFAHGAFDGSKKRANDC